MFGFIVGTACLVGFIAVYRRGAHRKFTFRWIFHELDTSAGQERVLRNALALVRKRALGFATDGKSSRQQLAALLRAPEFDKERVSDWFVAREQELTELRHTAVDALGEVHEVLDDQQRETLAHLVEKMHYRTHACRKLGPYRSRASEAS